MPGTQGGRGGGRKKYLTLALRLAVSAALIAWIFARTDFHEVAAAFRSAALWPILVSAALLNPVGHYCSVNRWRLLLRAQGFDVPFGFLLRSFLIGVFFNHLLPGTVGGDAARAWESSRAGTGKTRALAVVLVDRFLGLLTLMAFAAVGLLLSAEAFRGVPGLRIWVALALAGMVAVAALIFVPSPRLSEKVGTFLARSPGQWGTRGRQAWDSLRAFQGKTWVLVAALAWSLGLQTMVVLNGYFLARAVNVHLPLPLFFVLVPVAIFVMMIPVSINAIGVRENVFAFAFAALSVPDAAAAGVAVAWLDYGLLLVQALIGGAVYAFARRSAPAEAAEPPATEGAAAR
ncbi:MAG TPA: lysylphosphatidylglycerol synthase transmembrane domain-containing protein [Thermoanaerobaculia bacterium]|nr:lysylphosphatidylglycerol synthase transmembrane domain-containing protein [Thermoanaerobaculia bacterium]